jgi:hypothetical protein
MSQPTAGFDAAARRKPRVARDTRPPALGTLLAGVGLALSRPRIWLPLTALVILLSLVASYPVQDAAQSSFGHVAGFEQDRSLLESGVLPRWMFDDQGRERNGMGSPSALAPLMLLASLLGVLFAGGWMEIALHRRKEHGLMAFLGGGGQHFFPFLRLWVVALAGYAFCTWFVYGLPGDWLKEQLFPAGDPERASSESRARLVDLLYSLLYLWGLLKIEIIIDLARATLVASDRRSAIGAVFRALGFWIKRWWACLVLVGGGLLLEAAVLFFAISAYNFLSLPLWVIALVLPAARVVLRGGRQAGLALYYQQVSDSVRRRPLKNAGMITEPIEDGSAWHG